MGEPSGRGIAGEFTILDGAALVAGAAVASVHLRGFLRSGSSDAGRMVGAGVAFLWLTLTAAGPFLYLVRKQALRMPGYPGVGDRLWGLMGLPWILNVASAGMGKGVDAEALRGTALGLTLVIASVIAGCTIWFKWVAVSREEAGRTFSTTWTNRVGLVLAVAWPLQCALGMVASGVVE